MSKLFVSRDARSCRKSRVICACARSALARCSCWRASHACAPASRSFTPRRETDAVKSFRVIRAFYSIKILHIAYESISKVSCAMPGIVVVC